MYSRVSLLNCPKTKNSQFTASTEADDQSVSLTYFKLQAGLFHACTTHTHSDVGKSLHANHMILCG